MAEDKDKNKGKKPKKKATPGEQAALDRIKAKVMPIVKKHNKGKQN